MVLFGKELKLESDFNPKEAKMFAVFISVLVILGLAYVLVYTPTMTIKISLSFMVVPYVKGVIIVPTH